MGLHRHLTNAIVEEALRANAGIKAHAAEALGVKRGTIGYWVKRSPHLQAVIAETEETLLDLCEGIVVTELRDKKDRPARAKMARWYLMQKGRSRGYGSRVEVDISEESIERLCAALAQQGPDILRAAIAALDQEP